MTIKFLQARNGDCIHIRFKENEAYINILIDGGTSRAYEFKNAKQRWDAGELKLLIATIKERKD